MTETQRRTLIHDLDTVKSRADQLIDELMYSRDLDHAEYITADKAYNKIIVDWIYEIADKYTGIAQSADDRLHKRMQDNARKLEGAVPPESQDLLHKTGAN
tara:strand:+ start:355 stop:657 length:303 start_codon:yes stop_codon:yes gene_type:complete